MQRGDVLKGKYVLLDLIGKGGMGSVYRAENLMTREPLAIKFMNVEFVEDKIHVERFKREIETLKSIRHPNVVNIYDWFVPEKGEDREPFLVMEFLEGEPLSEILKKRKKLTCNETITIMLQVLDGLECAHQKDIIHRDLGPPNVFLIHSSDKMVRVKLLDFGLAKPISSDESISNLTSEGVLIGKPGYVPPEIFWKKTLDARSDIFSCGMMVLKSIKAKLFLKGI